MPNAVAAALLHVMHGRECERYWEEAVSSLSTMSGLGRSQVWLALLQALCNDQPASWAHTLVAMSQCRYLLERALAEAAERGLLLSFPEPPPKEEENPIDYELWERMRTPRTPSSASDVHYEAPTPPRSSASSAISIPGINAATRRVMQDAINKYARLYAPTNSLSQPVVAVDIGAVRSTNLFRELAKLILEEFNFQPTGNEHPKDTVDAFIHESKGADETYEHYLDKLTELYEAKKQFIARKTQVENEQRAARLAGYRDLEPELLAEHRPQPAQRHRTGKISSIKRIGESNEQFWQRMLIEEKPADMSEEEFYDRNHALFE